jgi:hypothetical protein
MYQTQEYWHFLNRLQKWIYGFIIVTLVTGFLGVIFFFSAFSYPTGPDRSDLQTIAIVFLGASFLSSDIICFLYGFENGGLRKRLNRFDQEINKMKK